MLKKIKKSIYSNRITIVGMAIVVILYLTNMIINGFAPFGDEAIISGDNTA